ncbi:MAG: hypothetical protein ACOVOO_06020 [Flavobacteriales bacterium]
MRNYLLPFMFIALSLGACKKDEPAPTETPDAPRLIFKFAFDPNQERLNNLGQPSTVPTGHAAQSPIFNSISAHYLEMAPSAFTALGGGEVLYVGPETSAGGDLAIDFGQSKVVAAGERFFSIPLSQVTPGDYEYMRVSLAYQNYNISIRQSGFDFQGTLASFIGYNTYIQNYTINSQNVEVNDDKLQGYWGFETMFMGTPYWTQGQAPAGATTVPNPIFATSPIPSGSCVVTAPFQAPLTITGNETEDIVITLSLSTNNSFEWIEQNVDGKYEPSAGEAVVDMGIRGLIPYVN